MERFDRIRQGEDVVSLAVEDACQLLDLYPADKYAVGSEEVTLAAAEVCAARPVAARAALTQFAFAWLTGNGDLHAKNLSVLRQPTGEWRVAPVYDIPSTMPYGDLWSTSSSTRRSGPAQPQCPADPHPPAGRAAPRPGGGIGGPAQAVSGRLGALSFHNRS